MELTFKKVETPQEQEKLAALASAIWNEYWPALLGQAQVDYMVEKFQSLGAIRRDMAENAYEYWFVMAPAEGPNAERIIGYTGGHPEPETNRYFISKIYLLQSERRHGCAQRVVSFYDDHARKLGFQALYLTVNKYNAPAIRAYEKNGFVTIDAAETSIGGGYIMDDYIMERPVSK